MNTEFSKELIAKASTAANPEELLLLAGENGIELTPEQAAEYYEALHKSGELSDDELGNVAGGKCQTIFDEDPETKVCPECGGIARLYYRSAKKGGHKPSYRCESCDYDSHKWYYKRFNKG